MPPNAYHWRTSGGAEVDLFLERGGRLYPIEIKCKTNLTKGDLRGPKAFRYTYANNEVMPGFVIYAGDQAYPIDEMPLTIPWKLL